MLVVTAENMLNGSTIYARTRQLSDSSNSVITPMEYRHLFDACKCQENLFSQQKCKENSFDFIHILEPHRSNYFA